MELRQRLAIARELIKDGDYQAARAVLMPIEHDPTASTWLSKLPAVSEQTHVETPKSRRWLWAISGGLITLLILTAVGTAALALSSPYALTELAGSCPSDQWWTSERARALEGFLDELQVPEGETYMDKDLDRVIQRLIAYRDRFSRGDHPECVNKAYYTTVIGMDSFITGAEEMMAAANEDDPDQQATTNAALKFLASSTLFLQAWEELSALDIDADLRLLSSFGDR